MKKQLFLFQTDPGGSGGGNDPDPADPAGSGVPPAGEDDPGGQSDDVVPRTELAKANSEAAKFRRELRDAQKKLEVLEGQQKTDIERERDRAKKLEAELSEAQMKTRGLRVQVIAAKVGIVPEARSDAARILDWDKVADPDDDAAVEEALRDLVKDRTFLLGNVPGGADGGAGGSRDASAQGDMNSLLRAAAGRG